MSSGSLCGPMITSSGSSENSKSSSDSAKKTPRCQLLAVVSYARFCRNTDTHTSLPASSSFASLVARLSELSENPSALFIETAVSILPRNETCTKLTLVSVRRIDRSYLLPHPCWAMRACGCGELLGVETGPEFECHHWTLRYPDQDQLS